MKKVILSLIVIILIGAIAVGGYYIYDKLQKVLNKIDDIENRIIEIENSSKKENLINEQEEINKGKEQEEIIKSDTNYLTEYIKIVEKTQKEDSDINITCDLIYFNDDDIPDLVVSNLGYWVSLYIYKDGEIYNPIDKWPYGAGGNAGYQYQERKGIILNHNADYAGAIITKTIEILNSKFKFDSLSYTDKGAEVSEDEKDMINEALNEYGGYYYNGKKINKEQYEKLLKPLSINSEKLKWLEGHKTISDLKKMLK